jgi:glucose-1-phosphate cytidylyltransferase
MQTIIFCGGLGTRMHEETEFRPKPMVKIGQYPMIWHIMKIYAHYNHTDFVLALGYKGDMIKEYFLNYEAMNNDITIELGKREAPCMLNCHDETGWKVTLANTGEKCEKGGRLKKVEKYIQGDIFMLTYGDGVANVDISKLIKFHKSHGKMVTLTGVYPIARFGELQIDGQQVKSFREKPQISGGSMINGGFFVLNREIFDYLTPEDDCDFEYGPLERLAERGELMVFEHEGFWHCMDTVRDAKNLNKLWEHGSAPWKIW